MTSIKYFEILGDIINTSIDAIARQRGISRQDAYEEVIKHLRNNSQEWRNFTTPNSKRSDGIYYLSLGDG